MSPQLSCLVRRPLRNGYTLVEIALVLGLLLVLSTAGIASFGYISRLSCARHAESILRQVDNARMSYLTDNPSLTYQDVTLAALTNYMSDPAMLTNLPALGYTLSDANVQSYPLSYGIAPNSSALPLTGY